MAVTGIKDDKLTMKAGAMQLPMSVKRMKPEEINALTKALARANESVETNSIAAFYHLANGDKKGADDFLLKLTSEQRDTVTAAFQ